MQLRQREKCGLIRAVLPLNGEIVGVVSREAELVEAVDVPQLAVAHQEETLPYVSNDDIDCKDTEIFAPITSPLHHPTWAPP